MVKTQGNIPHSSCTGKYDTNTTGTNTTAGTGTAEKKHGKFGREAADHHQALCLAMRKYENIILLKVSHISLADKVFSTPGFKMLRII